VTDATDPAKPVTWLRELLWPVDATETERPGYAVLSRRGRPRLVVPLASRKAAASALRRDSSDVTTARGLVRRGAAVAARFGLLQPLLRNRFVPGLSGEAEPLEEHLAGILGLPGVVLAVTVGSPRPNYKPVLQVMTPEGATVAFAKVGWNGLTRTLVTHEATELDRLDRRRLRRLTPPSVLHLGPWRSTVISVLSPLQPENDERIERRPPTPAELSEMAGIDPGGVQPLTVGGYWQRLSARVEAVAGETQVLAHAVEALGVSGAGLTVGMGRSHGDWTPWNMMPTDRRLLVWDWERTTASVPVLLDVLHYFFQTGWLRKGAPAAAALDGAVTAAATVAAALETPPEGARLLGAVYLVELSLRYAENAGVGTDELRADRHAAVDALLAGLIRSGI